MIVQGIVTILLFALLASPFMFRTVTGSAQPTPMTLILHGVVFVVLRGLLSRTVSLYGRSFDEKAYARQSQQAAEQRDAARQAGEAKLQRIYGGGAPPPKTTPVETADDKKARFAASQEARRSRQALRAAR